jgi:acyl carrier protein
MEGNASVERSTGAPAGGPGEASIEDRIKATLVKCLRLKLNPAAIPNDVPLIGKGLGLDSVSVLQLVGAVEETFGIVVDDTDINRDLFRNVSALAGYVRRKLGA